MAADSSSTLAFAGASVAALALAYKRMSYVWPYNGEYVHGVMMPFFQGADRHEKVASFLTSDKPGALNQETDVWIATFPKCGTTWMQQLVVELTRTDLDTFSGTAPGSVPKADYRASPWPEAALFTVGKGKFRGKTPEELMASLRGPPGAKIRPFKTHAPLSVLPGGDGPGNGGKSKKIRCIVVTRNAKDACVSMFYHARNIPPFGYDGPWHDWSRRWFQGDVESGSYWEWYSGWWAEHCAEPDRVLWVHYEDLKADPVGETTRVARFLKLDKTCRDVDDFQELVKGAVTRSTFKSMKKQYAQRNSTRKQGHFRKGKVGDWRAHFSEEESAKFDRRTAEMFPPELQRKFRY